VKKDCKKLYDFLWVIYWTGFRWSSWARSI
jgi:hypothetical protein